MQTSWTDYTLSWHLGIHGLDRLVNLNRVFGDKSNTSRQYEIISVQFLKV